VLQRVIAPLDPDPDVLPLYVEPANTTGSVSATPKGRDAWFVAPRSAASFGTYFNAFPAAYWARWTDVGSVCLTLRLDGAGSAEVFRSDEAGRVTSLGSYVVHGDTTVVMNVALAPMIEGGWLWFDVSGADSGVQLTSAEYSAEVASDGPNGSAIVAITTFNRADYCLALLCSIAARLADLDCVERVVVVDQGTKKVTDAPGFAEVANCLGDRLRVIDQPNFGGSGGFARGMLEALSSGQSRYVLLLDDDIVLEPESVVRAVQFAEACREPTIVGGHMLNLSDKASLHSFGEDVDMTSFWWGPADGVEPDHDFARDSLRRTAWMHRRIDVGYSGWWMCLIPTEVLRRLGLSQPFFIKWDDAEYALRGRGAGIPTVTLPGMAVWHVPWTAKDDSSDWQAYFHLRNRLVAALLHGGYGTAPGLLAHAFAHQVASVLALRYSTAALRLKAMEAVLAGPDALRLELPHVLDDVVALRETYPDGRVELSPHRFPEPSREWREPCAKRPTGLRKVAAVARGVIHQFTPVPAGAHEKPQAVLAAEDATWWRLARMDSVVGGLRTKGGFVWYRRDRRLAGALLLRSFVALARLGGSWNGLAEWYRGQVYEMSGEAAWRSTLGAVDQ
jgi:galactofuranosylgalactofuranosylrhamnosyl-N-acetylglucosaminyl-diphospho-decaprenol beta-1,5/1,6-galactofuranosyltransferase